MKRCFECNAIYENNLDVCPTCGEPLENYTPSKAAQYNLQRQQPIIAPEPPVQRERTVNSPYVFEQQRGRDVVINGAVAETNTQQYYQSKFAKIIQAIFAGEPYQLNHTTFVTILRVEEHVMRGYPERARDITLYGNMQNVFAVGDDVTVTARRKGRRLVARNIFNHTINDKVRVQPLIPAFIIRIFAILVAFIAISLICAIFTADYAAIGGAIGRLIVSLLPLILGIWLVWSIIKGFFKK